MSAQPQSSPAVERPQLLFFYSHSSGQSRRVEGFLAQVLQRRRNHDTFELLRIDFDARHDLARRFGVEEPPALVVVEAKRVKLRVERPRGCVEIQTALAPWLR
jgi:thioredoxin-like negative regulator of GroEL